MFLPLGETTVIDRIYAELEGLDRIDEAYVSTNERFATDFENHLEDTPYDKPRLSVEETAHEDEKLGVVGALEQLIDREGLDEDLLVIAGDNLFDFAIEDFLHYFDRRDGPAIAAYDIGSRERATSYGVIELDDERVVDFQEKPAEPESSLVSIGCYAFPGETLSLFTPYLEAGNDPDEPGWFVQWLQDRCTVHAFSFEDAWFDIGTPASYLDAVAWTLDGDNLVSDDATVEDSTLGENVHVMAGAEVVNSNLDNSVVFPNASIYDCDVRNSIVDEETHLEQIDFSGALIGAHTTISNQN